MDIISGKTKNLKTMVNLLNIEDGNHVVIDRFDKNALQC